MRTIGIDLGTTNTVAAANARVLPLTAAAPPTPILPSVVAYLPSGESAVGAPARLRRAIDVKNTIYSAKRVIGETWSSYRAREFCAYYPFDFVQAQDGQVGFKTRAGVRTATDVAAQVLGALCSKIGADPRELDAVVTVPAAFGPAQRAATLQAAKVAGFTRARCIVEPVATAIAYLDRNDVHYGAVYDLGGGTFDLAIVDCSVEPMRVVAHGGDPYLGGDDIDHALAAFIADTILRERGWDLRSDAEVFMRLVMEAERAKVQLTSENSVQVELGVVDPAAPFDLPVLTLDRRTVWELSAALIKRTFVVCDQVLHSAGLTVRDIQAVFLAGGATLLPGVRDAVGEYFGKKLRFELDPMHVVSLGASMAAARPRFAPLLLEG
jgi:molecular chaperone DnaK (HSP70)